MFTSAGPLGLVGLSLLGLSLLWARRIVYHHLPGHRHDVPRLVLGIGGNLLILVGLLGLATHASLWLAPITCGSLLVVAFMLVMRYRGLERRALLRCLAVAADKGIPLHDAVRGFADERNDELGYRASILADALERGTSLPEALRQSKTRLSSESLLAMRLGYETGVLGSAVARVGQADEELERVSRSLFESYIYLFILIGPLPACIAFFVHLIGPPLQRTYDVLDLQVPEATRLAMSASEFVIHYQLLVYLLLLGGCLMLVIPGLHYLGILPRDFPGVSWLVRRFDAALVMRTLALAVSRRWPLNQTTALLARIFPRRRMRKRLREAGRRMDQGEDWCDSLRSAGIIGQADWAVLRSASRLANVEWALEEMADSSLRRLIYRWRMALNIVFPIALLVLGGVVAFFVIGFFLPIVSLIQGLI